MTRFTFSGPQVPECLGTPFAVAVEPIGDTIVVTLEGDLDLNGLDVLEAAMTTALAGNPEVVLIDLSAISFVDSTGMRAVLRAESRSVRSGARVHIAPAPPAVQRVFVLCGLDAVLPFLPQDNGPKWNS